MTTSTQRTSVAYAAISGFCLFVIAIGINRFAYTPIIPFLVNHHWVTLPQAGYIGSTNLFGYFLGAYLTPKLVTLFSKRKLMLMTLVISVAASTLCMVNLGYIWLSVMRLLLGIGAGMIMILAPTVILSDVANQYKAIVSGMMFCGVGIGTAIGSIFIPLFGVYGNVIGIWLGLAAITGLLSLVTLNKCLTAAKTVVIKSSHHIAMQPQQRKSFILASAGYGLYGISMTPSLLFLSDYSHQVLGASLSVSSFLFALFGIGCAIGSVAAGMLHQKKGSIQAIIIVSIIGIISLLALVLIHAIPAVAVSALLSGFYLIAITTLMSLFIGNLVGMNNHVYYWSRITLIFAATQFISGYAYSYMLNFHFSYLAMFSISLVMLLLSLIFYVLMQPRELEKPKINRDSY